ncbi:hypothetical protein [Luteipulveratus mongoliensis]|uniref:Uncharacterized protein n=1 Tax=Luteipulveratus mongoliensis TaxID=571913 RepID=A0A0K1JEV6_9MICO|nr:hypothetical protein [Luteipulveratus mongoliensis]AKU15229.1 hypothetical protein VV02_04050 [Luteipulveratus mongoliensis]
MGDEVTSWPKRIIAMALCLICVGSCAIAAKTLFLDGAPPRSAGPRVPAGYVVTGGDTYPESEHTAARKWVVQGPPGTTAAQVVDQLGGTTRRCGHVSLVDWRRSCRWAEVSGVRAEYIVAVKVWG